MRILHHDGINHTQSCKHNWRLLIIESLNCVGLYIHQVVAKMLIDVIEGQVALAPNDGGLMPYQLFQDWNNMTHQVVREEVPQESQSCHDHKGVLVLKVFYNRVVHEQTQLVSGLHEEGGQEVGHLLQVEVR